MALLGALLALSSIATFSVGYTGGPSASGLLPSPYGFAQPKWFNKTTPAATIQMISSTVECSCSPYTVTETVTVYTTAASTTTTTVTVPCSVPTSHVPIMATPDASSSTPTDDTEGKLPNSSNHGVYPYIVTSGTTSWLYGPPPASATVTTASEPITIVIVPTPEESDSTEIITITSTHHRTTTTTVTPTPVSGPTVESSVLESMSDITSTITITTKKTKTVTSHSSSALRDEDMTLTSSRTTTLVTTRILPLLTSLNGANETYTAYRTRYRTRTVLPEGITSSTVFPEVISNIPLFSVQSVNRSTSTIMRSHPAFANTSKSSEALAQPTFSSVLSLNFSTSQVQENTETFEISTGTTTTSTPTAASMAYANNTASESQNVSGTFLPSDTETTISASFPTTVLESFSTAIMSTVSENLELSSTVNEMVTSSTSPFAVSSLPAVGNESSTVVTLSDTGLVSTSHVAITSTLNTSPNSISLSPKAANSTDTIPEMSTYSPNSTSLISEISKPTTLAISPIDTVPEMIVTVYSHSYTRTSTVSELITTTLTTVRRSISSAPYEASSTIQTSPVTQTPDAQNPSTSEGPVPKFLLTVPQDSTDNSNSAASTNTIVIAESPGSPTFNIGMMQSKLPHLARDLISGRSSGNVATSSRNHRGLEFRG
jgi:hypothetical protein